MQNTQGIITNMKENRAGVRSLLMLLILVTAIISISGGVMAGNLRLPDNRISQGIQITNAADAPLVITKVMMEKKVQPDPLSATGTSPVITISLHNKTREPITAFRLTLNIASKFSTSFEPRVEIGPNSVYTMDATVPAGQPQDVIVKIAGVRFKNGSSWGSFDDTTGANDNVKSSLSRASTSRATAESTTGPTVKTAVTENQRIQISNAADAPLVITKVMMEKKVQPDPLSATGTSPVITISLHNKTQEPITAFRLTLNIASKFSTSFEPRVEIGPNSVYTMDATVPAGQPQDVIVKIAGVRFKNGSSWGSLNPATR